MSVPRLELNDGNAVPQLGFGVFQVPAEETTESVGHALRTGYRLIDTAAAYQNEREVGAAIRDSGVDRDEVFVTTKVWNNDHGHDRALRSFERSLQRRRHTEHHSRQYRDCQRKQQHAMIDGDLRLRRQHKWRH